MEKVIPIPELLEQLKNLLIQQSNIPSRFLDSSKTNGTENPLILPSSIPKLPKSVTTLPSNHDPYSISSLLSLLSSHILPYLNISSLSPNYYGFVTGGVTPAALLADFLVSIYDQNVHVHLPNDTISTTVEVAALNLLRELFWLPESDWAIGTKSGNGGGVITTGATASNVLGLGLGREWVIREAAKRRQNSERKGDEQDPYESAQNNGNTGEIDVVSCAELGLLKASRLAGIDDIIILSTSPHSSITKAASIVGIGRSNIIDISKKHNAQENDDNDNDEDDDDGLAIDISKLENLAKTALSSRKAYILVISSGEINTGRFATTGLKEMQEIRTICTEHGIWIHVDGAFGLFGRVLMNSENETETEEYKTIINGVQGLELADSITGDAHKLLNVPYDSGIFFTRHKTLSEDVFNNGNAAYLTTNNSASASASATSTSTSTTTSTTNTNNTNTNTNKDSDNEDDNIEIQSPLNISLENSRRFRALPIYSTLITYGRKGYTTLLTRQITLARKITTSIFHNPHLEILPLSSNLHEVLSKTFMVVLFRARDKKINEGLTGRINLTRKIYVSGTRWKGRKATRIAVSNWQVEVERDLRVVEGVLREVLDG